MENKKSALHIAAVGAKLLVICLVVAALVALVHAVTKDPIDKGEQKRKQDAIEAIFPAVASFEQQEGVTADGVNAVYRVYDADKNLLGFCVDYTGKSHVLKSAAQKKKTSNDIEFEVNGTKHKGKYSLGIISNANRIAGINNFYKDVKLDDDTFEVLLCSIEKRSTESITQGSWFRRFCSLSVPIYFLRSSLS